MFYSYGFSAPARGERLVICTDEVVIVHPPSQVEVKVTLPRQTVEVIQESLKVPVEVCK